MTITEQIRLKLKTVDDELRTARESPLLASMTHFTRAAGCIDRARRVLRQICELDGSDERTP